MEIINGTEVVVIKNSFLIPFTDRTDNLGCAEFELCTRFKRGLITDVWIVPRQQELKTCFHYKPDKPYQKHVFLNGYEGLDYPMVWNYYYCKIHKCQCIRFYVPPGAKYLWVETLSTLTIGFLKTPLNAEIY